MKHKTQPKLENLGSLATYKNADGSDVCLGYLMDFKEKGIFEPKFGKVDVTPEQAEVHNKLLDEALLKGLDETCKVGQGGNFYVSRKDGRVEIKTFLGTLVSDKVRQNGQTVTFERGGKSFRGRTSGEQDLFNFRRIA